MKAGATLAFGSNTQNGTTYTGTFEETVSFNVYGGTVSLQNGGTSATNLGKMTLNADLDLKVDVDLDNCATDTITADSFEANGYNIKVSSVNLIQTQTSTEKSFTISLLGEFTDESVRTAMADAIQYTGGELVYSPIYQYTVSYDSATGLLTFTKLEDPNPSTMVAPVAAVAGSYLTQLNLYDTAFQNMESVFARNSAFPQGKTDGLRGHGQTVWFRVFGETEDVKVKSGLKVSNEVYGALFGWESEIYELRDSWLGVFSVFGGYSGSNQKYDDEKISQDGGNVGVVGMIHKKNFFTGLTVNAGLYSCDATTVFGDEDFRTFTTGIASKTGYNFKFSEGKYIVQPNATVSYSYIGVRNYTDAGNVRISADPLQAIQFEPGVKFIACLSDGWQPYAGISAVWSIMDAKQFSANEVALPELSIDPYAKYSLGVKKSFSDDIHGYVNDYATSGGREGFGSQIGVSLKW